MPSTDRDPTGPRAARTPAVAEIPPAGDAVDAALEAVVRIEHATSDAVDDAIDDALTTIGRAVAADRAYVFAYDFEVGLCHNTHEWCADGIEPQIALLQAFPLHLVPEWVARHRAGDVMDVVDVFSLPPESGVRQTLEPQGIKSVATVPLLAGAACIGFVGVDSVRRQRTFGSVERSVLETLAGALVRAYARLGRAPDALARASAAHDAVR